MKEEERRRKKKKKKEEEKKEEEERRKKKEEEDTSTPRHHSSHALFPQCIRVFLGHHSRVRSIVDNGEGEGGRELKTLKT